MAFGGHSQCLSVGCSRSASCAGHPDPITVLPSGQLVECPVLALPVFAMALGVCRGGEIGRPCGVKRRLTELGENSLIHEADEIHGP